MLTTQKMNGRWGLTALKLNIKTMSKRKLNASEAIYGFCGWLTTRDEKTVMSGKHDAAPIAERIKEFCETNNLDEPRIDWHKTFEHPEN